MVAKGQIAIDNIFKLANDSNSDNVKLDANKFIYESIFGKATNKLQDITKDNNENKISGDDLTETFNMFKVINIQKDAM